LPVFFVPSAVHLHTETPARQLQAKPGAAANEPFAAEIREKQYQDEDNGRMNGDYLFYFI
jgi:hypothetical protein